MAIQKDYNFKGILIANAYHRISWGSCYKDDAGIYKIRYDVEIKTSATGEVIDILNGSRCHECVYDILSPSNAIAQAYAHYMSLPENAGAVTV